MKSSDTPIPNPQSPIPNAVVPKHVGIILDGNRRWAKENGKTSFEGHKIGLDNINKIADYAHSKGVEHLTLYVFSTENWKRSEEEIKYLMGLIVIMFNKYLNDINKRDIRINWLGTYGSLSEKVVAVIEKAVEKTKENKGGNLNFCLNYGGRTEIVEAVQSMMRGSPQLSADEVTETLLNDNMYSPNVPDVDMIVRTSGEKRISHFMLWRAGYSELMFLDKHWPAFTTEDFDNVLREYSHRNRRFGC